MAVGEGAASSPTSAFRRFLHRLYTKEAFVIACATLVALLSNTVAGFACSSRKMNEAEDLSDIQMSVLYGLALVGVFFTVLAGWLNDRLGPLLVSVPAGAIVSLSYLALSYVTSGDYWLIIILVLLAGFGSGATFLCALASSLNLTPVTGNVGVAIVSTGMSLSLAVTNLMLHVYWDVTSKDKECWRGAFRLLSCATGVVLVGGSFGYMKYKPDAPLKITPVAPNPSPGDNTRVPEAGKPMELPLLHGTSSHGNTVTFAESLQVFRHPFFFILLFAYFTGVASGVFVFTQYDTLWKRLDRDTTLPKHLATGFSICNAIAVVSATLSSQYLLNRYNISRARFVGAAQILGSVVFASIGLLSVSVATDSGSYIAFFVLLVSVGLNYGAYLVLFPIIVSEIYGARDFGKTFAYLQLGSGMACVLLPVSTQWVFGSFDGGFELVLFILAALLALSGGLLFVYRQDMLYLPQASDA